jgi:hypothetical protein
MQACLIMDNVDWHHRHPYRVDVHLATGPNTPAYEIRLLESSNLRSLNDKLRKTRFVIGHSVTYVSLHYQSITGKHVSTVSFPIVIVPELVTIAITTKTFNHDVQLLQAIQHIRTYYRNVLFYSLMMGTIHAH